MEGETKLPSLIIHEFSLNSLTEFLRVPLQKEFAQETQGNVYSIFAIKLLFIIVCKTQIKIYIYTYIQHTFE